MPRYKLTIEYDGAPFVGWQRQVNGLSVQETLENALAAFASERAVVNGAGRTDDVIEIHASALSFLHHQVRSFAGSLEHVGSGKWNAQDLRAALEARDRSRCGVVAPPQGLCLTRVDY